MPSSPPSSYRSGSVGVGSVTYLNGTDAQIARVEHVLYDNLPDDDYRLWTFFMQRHRSLIVRDAAGSITNDTNVVEIEFIDTDPVPGDNAAEVGLTTWSGPDVPVNIKIWESHPSMANDNFFREAVVHEFGHVATYLLMEALGEDVVKQRMCDYYGIPVSRWEGASIPWQRRGIEATAEFFKDVMVPRQFREFDNRSDYKFPASAYPGWLGLFIKTLYNLNAGSDDGPFFSMRLVDDFTGAAHTEALTILYENGHYDPFGAAENPTLTPLRYPLPPLTFECDLTPHFPGADFEFMTWSLSSFYADLNGVEYARYDLPETAAGGVFTFTVPPAALPGFWGGVVQLHGLPSPGAWGTIWSDLIWAKLPDHPRFSAWDPGAGLTLPPTDDTKGLPPYPTYFPPYPYDIPAMNVAGAPPGTIRHHRGVGGQQYGKPLVALPISGGSGRAVTTRAARDHMQGTVRH